MTRLVAGLASAQDSIAHWTDVSELPEAREAGNTPVMGHIVVTYFIATLFIPGGC